MKKLIPERVQNRTVARHQKEQQEQIDRETGEALDTIEAGVNTEASARMAPTGPAWHSSRIGAGKADVTSGLAQLSRAQTQEFNLNLGTTTDVDLQEVVKGGSEIDGMKQLERISPKIAARVKKEFPWLRLVGVVVVSGMGLYFKSEIQAALAGQPVEPAPVAATAHPENPTE